MARKKNVQPIEGAGRDPDELLVQKSRPLYALWKSDLTLQEFKILDSYLARIDSHHPEKRVVVFEKGELEGLLGVSKINLPQLKDRLKHLMGNVVEVNDPAQPKALRLITLFEAAVAVQDEVTGQWTVHLECTQKAMKYCFNIEKLGYLRYRLRSIVSLQSRYSYILFLYLESQRDFKTWTVSLDELKVILRCDKEETYKEFKRFNDLIMKRCSKEIFEKTDQRFTYEPVKKGRKVVAIRFTLETISDLIEQDFDSIPGQMTLDDFVEVEDPHKAHLAFLSEACGREFTEEEMELIWNLVSQKELPDMPEGRAIAEYHYLKTQYARLRIEATRRKIVRRFDYFKAIIESQ